MIRTALVTLAASLVLAAPAQAFGPADCRSTLQGDVNPEITYDDGTMFESPDNDALAYMVQAPFRWLAYERVRLHPRAHGVQFIKVRARYTDVSSGRRGYVYGWCRAYQDGSDEWFFRDSMGARPRWWMRLSDTIGPCEPNVEGCD